MSINLLFSFLLFGHYLLFYLFPGITTILKKNYVDIVLGNTPIPN